MKRLNLFIVVILCCYSSVMLGQQDAQYTQYMYNTININPAYAGSRGTLSVFGLHRTQWVGLDGAPKTANFSIESPISENGQGLGLSVVNDKIGPSNELYLDGNFSYSLPLGYEKRLAFGIKAGTRMLNIDWSKGRYYDNTDVLLNQNIDNQMKLAVGAGVYYYTEKWYLGFSIPSFIENNYYDDVQESIDYDRLHYYLMGGYVFDLNDNIKFKPAFLVKTVEGSPLQADFSGNFLLHEKFTLGVAYRWDAAVSALAGFQITNGLFIGYGYDAETTKLRKYNSGSHEIFLRFDIFSRNNRIISPRFF